ncbi:MAG: divergent PAP2 family protein [Nanoarchaeota archaeon]
MQFPPVLVAVLLAGILSQGLKIVLLIALKRQQFTLKDLVVTGGMPSSHSAVVVSLVVSVYLTEGLSNLFIICAVLAAIVIRDALGVRRTAGEEGKLLNKVLHHIHYRTKPLHYSLGHTPVEVAVGVIIGITSGLVVLAL